VKKRAFGLAVILAFAIPIIVSATAAAAAATEDEAGFEAFRRAASLGFEPVLAKVFANDSVLAAIDALSETGVLRLDLDDDGRIDALAWREGTTRVVGIDEDGDLEATATRTDDDSDCVIADLGLDGIPDRAVDRGDPDHDGIADWEAVYEITRGALGSAGVGVLVYLNIDHGPRMFHLTDYGYHANRDMWDSDFGGNAAFVAGRRDETTGKWTSAFENPFCFYDNDADGVTDEALRLEGEDLCVTSLRWSFDADGDGVDHPDYDFSLTAIGPSVAPAVLADSLILRDGRALRFVAWNRARDFARWALWRSILLVWDEDDSNVAPVSTTPDRERWEGVIASPYRGFPGVGGPDCGRANKRYEIDQDGSGRLGIYFSSVDDRIHLRGAEEGEIDILLPGEPSIQRHVGMQDADGDGYFDSWSYSGGPHDRSIRLRNEGVRSIDLDARILRGFWRDALARARDRSRWNGDQLERSMVRTTPDPVRKWWMEARERNEPFVVRAGRSAEADRFIHDVLLWEAGGGFLALDPDESPDPDAPPPIAPAVVRVDPYFGRSIAFESLPIAYRTYDGRIDVFVKHRRQLILRGNLGDYHHPQAWGMDALDVGSGPGLGGLYILDGNAWKPVFGSNAVTEQRVVEERSDRVAVAVALRSGSAMVHRLWSITGDTPVIEERFTTDSGAATFGVALAGLAESGASRDSLLIWSFGASASNSERIGLAGAITRDHRHALTHIDGSPAISFSATPGDTVRLRWVAGGTSYGDSTAAAWVSTAAKLLSISR
jgi:hypothetical protein